MDLRRLLGRGKGATARENERLLIVRVNEQEVASVRLEDVPCEITPRVQIDGSATIEFEDAAGIVHRHHAPDASGWLHLSVRVHSNLGCQADAVITAAPTHGAGSIIGDGEYGLRFQPFFLPGAPNAPALHGRGMFARGLHFSGLVTPANVLLSCECDQCARTFTVRSFHAGFSETSYFYSASGRYTLLVDATVEGAPAPLSEPDPQSLASLEARLPPAPDGTRFGYYNPFRCPHCSAPYVNFTAYPEQRAGEYYGLYFPDVPPIRLEKDPGEIS